MLKKTEKLVISFYTTTQAMAMESLCREEMLDGRLIPVPGSISAGCGLAWCAEIGSEPVLLEAMTAHGIDYQGLYRCLI